ARIPPRPALTAVATLKEPWRQETLRTFPNRPPWSLRYPATRAISASREFGFTLFEKRLDGLAIVFRRRRRHILIEVHEGRGVMERIGRRVDALLGHAHCVRRQLGDFFGPPLCRGQGFAIGDDLIGKAPGEGFTGLDLLAEDHELLGPRGTDE